jgi:hypothetical protein
MHACSLLIIILLGLQTARFASWKHTGAALTVKTQRGRKSATEVIEAFPMRFWHVLTQQDLEKRQKIMQT